MTKSDKQAKRSVKMTHNLIKKNPAEKMCKRHGAKIVRSFKKQMKKLTEEWGTEEWEKIVGERKKKKHTHTSFLFLNLISFSVHYVDVGCRCCWVHLKSDPLGIESLFLRCVKSIKFTSVQTLAFSSRLSFCFFFSCQQKKKRSTNEQKTENAKVSITVNED